MERSASGGNRRSPGGQKRGNVLSVRLSDGELDAVRAAAARARMARSAWVGKVATDAAEHRALPVGWLQREVVGELIRLRGQVLIAGNNVNQIARALNSGDAPGGDLEPVIRHLADVVARVEQAAETVRRRM
jgi:Bacterial mobilisation protein (MobC)